MNELFDSLKAEKAEGDVLIDRGVAFTVPKRSILKWFSPKERSFTIHQPYLGTLDIISRIFLEIEIDENLLQENTLPETRKLIVQSARKCALIVAVSVLNSRWKIKYLSKMLSRYFLWRIQPDKLLKLAIYINQINNLGDFISSIRLMSMIRTTAPRIEKQAEQQA